MITCKGCLGNYTGWQALHLTGSNRPASSSCGHCRCHCCFLLPVGAQRKEDAGSFLDSSCLAGLSTGWPFRHLCLEIQLQAKCPKVHAPGILERGGDIRSCKGCGGHREDVPETR